MVVIAVIGILIGIAIINLPTVSKSARDAQRASDLRQLGSVLERVKTDSEAYPLSDSNYQITNQPWGSLWSQYSYRVPQDPLPSQKYIYVSDGQTYGLYAKLENPKSSQIACATACGPDGTYNSGVTGGTGSALISWSSTTGTTQPTGGTTGGTGGVASGPTKPFTPLPPGAATYNVSGGTPPFLNTVTLSELDPVVGTSENLSAVIDAATAITSATAVVKTDNGVRTFPLAKTSGADNNGTWGVTWVVADTHNKTYVISIRATDAGGESSNADITIR